MTNVLSDAFKLILTICCFYTLIAFTVSTIYLLHAPEAHGAESKAFGFSRFSLQTTGPTREISENNGLIRTFINEPELFTQAGGHPWGLTSTMEFTSEETTAVEGRTVSHATIPTRDPKDIAADLPQGLLFDPQAVPRCPLIQLLELGGPCPAATQVGFVKLHLFDSSRKELLGPIVNVTPEAGQSAEFGLKTDAGITYVLTGHVVRTQSGYTLTGTSNEIPLTELVSAELTFWGVPADPSHDSMRGLYCSRVETLQTCHGGDESAGIAAVPFVDMPADCAAGPETATVSADSWEEPGKYVTATTTLPGATGCDALQFDPAIEAQPDTLLADAPVGLGVNLKVPQVESPEASVTPQLRDAVVTLPEGMSVSPSIVDGIQACQESGPEGINFTGLESEDTGLNGEAQLAPGHCPDASIVGTAEAETPLLASPVKGHVYLAKPGCGGAGQAPCTEQDAVDGNLYRLYLELGGTGALASAGVNIKVAGEVEANPATGQLTTKFLDNAQLPFNELRIRLNGGPRAALDNPVTCGPAVTTTDFTPWSAPGITPQGLSMPGTIDATPSSAFEVQGCANPPGLSPGFVAGTVAPQAGKFSAFTLNLSRKDREQYVKGLQVHTPPGLLGMLSSVPLCGEVQAEAGDCPEASRIGTTRVATGAGSHPFEIEGSVYLTSSYRGAPYGLSIVTHAVAGPFNLGLVVVRARIAVDPETSALTVTTDESGPHAIPQIVFGVPLRLQRVTVNIDRPGFMFNPTNCSAQQITAKVSGSQQAVASVSSPFAIGGCRSLAFKPKFTVSTSGHTNRADGASLDAKVSYPAGSFGNEANIAKVKVSLPKQLPSRLTTLQKACPSAVFDANPAGCPPGSVVGIVRASTPLLPAELAGPVYFVSHGGEAFPSLIVVLQSEGVRVDLTGATFIDKAGITSSTFRAIPDVPVNSFELYLPEGRYSALAANGNLCAMTRTVTVKRKLTEHVHVHGRIVSRTVEVRQKQAVSLIMPSEFVAQNGAVLRQSTKIAVTGCGAGKAEARSSGRGRAAGTRRGVANGKGSR